MFAMLREQFVVAMVSSKTVKGLVNYKTEKYI